MFYEGVLSTGQKARKVFFEERTLGQSLCPLMVLL